MRNTSDVSRVVDAIADAVAVELASSGWRRRAPGRLFGLETFTRDLGSGVLATINVIPPVISIGTEWPEELLVDIGVDFEPALDLAPLLTLPVMPMLVRAPTTDGRSNGKVTVAGDRADQRAEVVREIVSVYATRAVEFAGRFDAAEILAVLRRDIDGDDGKWWYQRYLTMLVALGRGDDALGALVLYEQRFVVGHGAADARRFARQVRRWATGSPATIPPVEQTLAVLPPPRRLSNVPKPDLREAWRSARAIRAAMKTVEADAGGRSLAELREMLTAEYAIRAVAVSAISVAVSAEHIASGRNPFARVERGVQIASAVASAVVQVARVFTRSDSTANPDWLTPPERAAYRVKASDDHVVAVWVDDGARAYLDRAVAEGRHLGSSVHVPVWLTAPESPHDAARVHLGARPIGVIAPTETASFASAFRAAAMFDEDLTIEARIYRTIDGVHLVEVPAGMVW